MIETIIAALLPIVVTILLGFLAGWHHYFDSKQASTLSRMVMLYALPLTLFVGMMGLSRDVLLQQKTMALILLITMVGGYALVYLLTHYVLRKESNISALLALCISGPSIPFVGIPVLGFLFGNVSTIPVALGSIIMNLIQVPLTVFILSSGNTTEKKISIKDNMIHTLKEPVVWAPILGVILLFCNIHIPAQISSSLKLLGGATGGAALFAAGIVLYSYRVVFNLTTACTIIAKNIIMPTVAFGIAYLFGADIRTVGLSVITIAIPTASIGVILSVQYKIAEQQIASILFCSTIFSIVTMSVFLYFFH